MLRKVECDNIFVLAKSGDIANTESHITMALTESGASCINKSPLPPTEGGSRSSRHTGREGTRSLPQLLVGQTQSLQLRKAVAGLISKV